MKTIIIKTIKFYQAIFSPDKGLLGRRRMPTCVFYPTCSDYTIEAVLKYGVFKGLWLSAKRISRCHPWQKNHIDPVK